MFPYLKHFGVFSPKSSGSAHANAPSAYGNFKIGSLAVDGNTGALLFLVCNFHQEMGTGFNVNTLRFKAALSPEEHTFSQIPPHDSVCCAAIPLPRRNGILAKVRLRTGLDSAGFLHFVSQYRGQEAATFYPLGRNPPQRGAQTQEDEWGGGAPLLWPPTQQRGDVGCGFQASGREGALPPPLRPHHPERLHDVDVCFKLK